MAAPFTYILGIDEAGRGPIAGPVAVGVVRVKHSFDVLAAFPGLNDSKKLTEKKREKIFELLQEHVAAGDVQYHVSLISAKHIDGKGIVDAVRTGLEKGIEEVLQVNADGAVLTHEGVHVYLDGSLHAPQEYSQETIIGGDAKIPTIMLASVAAKVTRDRWMTEIAQRFPSYQFEKHKGYGTAAHYAALRTNGLCDEHRRSFLKNFAES